MYIVTVAIIALAVVYALRRMFTRDDIGWGRKIAWTMVIIASCGLLPVMYAWWDVISRQDIERSIKVLWVVAFIASSLIVALFYGLVALSTSDLLTGQEPTPRGT